MNKLTTLLALFLLIIPVGVFAQEGTMQTPKSEYPILENKLKKSEKAIADEKKSLSPKTWLNRADLMMDIYDVNRKFIEGKPIVQIQFSFGTENEKLTEEKDGSTYETYVYERVNIILKDGNLYNYIETNKIYDVPLIAAWDALKKAEELDVDGKIAKKLPEAFTKLAESFEHKGGREYYYNTDYVASFTDFEAALAIQSKDMVGPIIDTTLMYHTGLIGVEAKEFEKSNKYFAQALKYNYPKPGIYASMKRNYFELGDTTAGIDILKTGFEKEPESQEIVIEFINYYLNTGKTEEALEYIKMAQAKDPSNISLAFAEATMLDKLGKPMESAAKYKEVIATDPEYFDAYFNLGVVYYYYGKKLFDQASGANVSNEDYERLLKEGNDQLRNAIEPMEKCVELLEAKDSLSAGETDTLKSVYETLKSVYYRFEMTDKYNVVDEKLKAMGGE